MMKLPGEIGTSFMPMLLMMGSAFSTEARPMDEMSNDARIMGEGSIKVWCR